MRALVVEDDPTFLRLLVELLVEEGVEVEGVEDLASARAALAGAAPDLCVLDIGLPRDPAAAAAGEVDPEAGVELLDDLAGVPGQPRLVVLSGRERDFAVRLLLERRIHEYLFKDTPWDEVTARLRAQLDQAARARDERGLRRELGRSAGTPMVGESQAFAEVLRRAQRVAATDTAVLVTGESGTGKELLARYLHAQSPRADQPFVIVNCAAVPEGLFESELFGHRKGAFTGAHEDRPGRFELADGGTLFLDEVGEIPLALQPKLLRVLQEGTFERIGEGKTRAADVRVLSATNRDLEAECAAGRFREDLMYRLNVVPLRLPALRERREDIRGLTRHLLEVASRRVGRRLQGVSAEAMRALEAAPWPGNIRQLANVLEAALIFEDGDQLTLDSLSGLAPKGGAASRAEPGSAGAVGAAGGAGAGLAADHKQALEDFERRYLEHHLRAAGGNTGQAAEAVGLPARTLRHRLQKLGMAAADYRDG